VKKLGNAWQNLVVCFTFFVCVAIATGITDGRRKGRGEGEGSPTFSKFTFSCLIFSKKGCFPSFPVGKNHSDAHGMTCDFSFNLHFRNGSMLMILQTQ